MSSEEESNKSVDKENKTLSNIQPQKEFVDKENKKFSNPQTQNEFGDKENKKFSNPKTQNEFGDKENKKFSNPKTQNEFGDFEEVDKVEEENFSQEGEVFVRARLPRGNEKIGIILQRLGGNRMDVFASDLKKRNCRVPGRYKRQLWLRPNDFVLIVPWEDDDNKGDVIYKYPSAALNQLRKRGMLDFVKKEF